MHRRDRGDEGEEIIDRFKYFNVITFFNIIEGGMYYGIVNHLSAGEDKRIDEGFP